MPGSQARCEPCIPNWSARSAFDRTTSTEGNGPWRGITTSASRRRKIGSIARSPSGLAAGTSRRSTTCRATSRPSIARASWPRYVDALPKGLVRGGRRTLDPTRPRRSVEVTGTVFRSAALRVHQPLLTDEHALAPRFRSGCAPLSPAAVSRVTRSPRQQMDDTDEQRAADDGPHDRKGMMLDRDDP